MRLIDTTQAIEVTIRLDLRDASPGTVLPDDGVLSHSDYLLLHSFLEENAYAFPNYIISLEIAEKTQKLHFQGIITTHYNLQTYRNKFTAYFKDTHPGSKKSAATVKSDRYVYYCSKDGRPFFIKGYTDEQIEEIKKEWHSRDTYAIGKTPADNWFNDSVDEMKRRGVTCHTRDVLIVAHYLDYYLERCKREPQDHQIKTFVKNFKKIAFKEHYGRESREYAQFLVARSRYIIGDGYTVYVDEQPPEDMVEDFITQENI